MNWYMIKTKDTYVSHRVASMYFFIYLKIFEYCFKKLNFSNFLNFFWIFKFLNFCDVRRKRWSYDWWKHQYGCHLSVLSHRALGTVECDESYSNEGGPYLVVGLWGMFLPWVILRCRHDHIWISNFLLRQFRGWGYALIGHRGGVYPYMGTPQRRGFLGCIKLITPYY